MGDSLRSRHPPPIRFFGHASHIVGGLIHVPDFTDQGRKNSHCDRHNRSSLFLSNSIKKVGVKKIPFFYSILSSGYPSVLSPFLPLVVSRKLWHGIFIRGLG